MGDDARMDAAVKDADGFFTTFLVSSWSPHIVRWAAAQRITPNQVTTVSIVLAVVAASAFATGARPGLVIGAVLVQAAFVADCVDGQLARYTRTGTPLGAWLDAVSDRAKEFVVYAGLAVGGAQAGEQDIWLLATSALALQALRHQANFAYAARRGADHDAQVPRDGPAMGAAEHVGAAGVRMAAALERSWLRWIKRIVVLPIGERFALISVTAAFAGPRATFIALLGWGVVAAVYMLSGRVLRSLADVRAPGGLTAATDGPAARGVGDVNAPLVTHRDDGPLARTLRRVAPRGLSSVWTVLAGGAALTGGLAVDGARTAAASVIGVSVFVLLGALSARGHGGGRLGWVVPPLLHTGEYVTVVVLAWRAGMPLVAFALLAVVAFRHHDLVYLDGGAQQPRPVDLLAGGWDGRMLLLATASLADAFTGVAVTLATWVTVLVAAAGTHRVRALVRDGATTDGRAP